MTTEQTQTHAIGQPAEPLALKLTAELGFLPEPDFCLDGGTLRCYYADTVRTIQAAERERCAQLLDAAHEQRKHIDNYAACYALMVREARLIEGPNVL